MNFKKLKNPYDFAYPVNDPNLFIGRQKELEDINYYLDQVELVNHPINLALLGKRSAGKTSFLNMINYKAEEKGFYTIRINLDEGDSEKQLSFFFKIFDSLLTYICETDNFGGVYGKTYDTYLDMVNSHIIPKDKTFCPFLFPIQYAKAISTNNFDSQVSDHCFKRDLVFISNEVKRPIILLFDECNVLSNSRVHLQKLRNIFMNLNGYMLVFAGTPELFPVMDDVFSPITRQFKKINIGAFENKKDTTDLIIKPLKQIDIVNTNEVFDRSSLYEIHNLSGGYPYEIQLICHIMFKQVQQGKATKMKLDINVMEEVRDELESSRQTSYRPIINKIRNLDKQRLLALSIFCEKNAAISFEQAYCFEYAINGNKNWKKDELKEMLNYFINEEILSVDNIGNIRFLGDDFDKIYIKYFAKEQGISIRFLDIPFSLIWNEKIVQIIGGNPNNIEALTTNKIDMEVDEFFDTILKKDNTTQFTNYSEGFISYIYDCIFDYREEELLRIFQVKWELPGYRLSSWYYFTPPYSECARNKVIEQLELIKKRLQDVEGNLEYTYKEFKTIPIDEIANRIIETEDDNLRQILSQNHEFRAMDLYLRGQNEDIALNVLLAYKYDSNLDSTTANNYAYLLLRDNELQTAEKLLTQARNTDEYGQLLALIHYNFAILEIKKGNLNEAFKKIGKSIELIPAHEIPLDCLFVVKIDEYNKLIIDEINQPDFLEVAKITEDSIRRALI